jgi:hypothetical protein
MNEAVKIVLFGVIGVILAMMIVIFIPKDCRVLKVEEGFQDSSYIINSCPLGTKSYTDKTGNLNCCAGEVNGSVCEGRVECTFSPSANSNSKYPLCRPMILPTNLALNGGRKGKYCADEPRGVICDRDTIRGPWEVFTIVNLGNNQVALKGRREGKYCADEPNGVICDRDTIRGPWEVFKFQKMGNNQIALKGGRAGKFCTDVPTGFICDKDTPRGPWEVFKWVAV